MIKYFAVGPFVALVATAGFAQPTNSSSSSNTTYNTPFGPVTHTQSTSPIGNGSYTTNSVSPGNGSSIQPYVGSSTLDPYPNNTPSTTGYSVGVRIPIGSSSSGSSNSTSNPTPNNRPTRVRPE
jgi:hypothetical protein